MPQQHRQKISSSPAQATGGAANRLDNLSGTLLNASQLRDPAGNADPQRETRAAHSSNGPSDPFLYLDGDRRAPMPAWIRAGTHHAEAGYLDSELGWIGVRADATSSGLHAALVPNSPEAARVLGSHLAGLNAFLSEQRTEPATVTMTVAQDGRGGSAMSDNLNEHSSAGRENGGSGEAGKEDQFTLVVPPKGPGPAVEAAAAIIRAAAGKYISVMA